MTKKNDRNYNISPSQKKYLFLAPPELKFPEQFNSYVFMIMEILVIAKKLGRVFVMPHIHSHPRNTMVCEAGETVHEKMIFGKVSYPLEYFFDIEKLREYTEVLPLSEFVKISKKLDILSCFSDKKYSDTIEAYGEKFKINKIIKTKDVSVLEKINDRFLGIAGYERGKYLVKSSPNWHDDANVDYWGIREHLVYHKRLQKSADDFIQKNLEEGYVAMHWRRGDRCHPEMGKVAEEIVDDEKEMKARLRHFLIKPMQKMMKRYGLKKVFMATNCGTEWHMNYLKKFLPIITYPRSESWKDLESDGLTEQLICSKADHFIASPYSYAHCSSFSRWIIDNRKISGRDKAVSYMKKMGPIKQNFLKRYLNGLLDITRPLRGKVGLRLKNFTQKNNQSKSQTYNTGLLLKDKIVTLDTRSATVGGSWYPDEKIARPGEPEMVKLFFEKSKKYKNPTIFDIGANTGSYSLLAKFSPSMQVYSFEPQPVIYDILSENIKLNDLQERVRPQKIALSDKPGKGVLHTPDEESRLGLATLGEPIRFAGVKTYEVDITTIDLFAEKNHIENVSMLKIDTEGAELFVLKGGEQTIRRNMPDMLIEFNKNNCLQFGYNSLEILHLLFSWGYDILWVDPEEIFCTKKQ